MQGTRTKDSTTEAPASRLELVIDKSRTRTITKTPDMTLHHWVGKNKPAGRRRGRWRVNPPELKLVHDLRETSRVGNRLGAERHDKSIGTRIPARNHLLDLAPGKSLCTTDKIIPKTLRLRILQHVVLPNQILRGRACFGNLRNSIRLDRHGHRIPRAILPVRG